MRDRKSRIIEVALPFVRRGATAMALAALVAGCDCTSKFLVPIDDEERDELVTVYRGNDLPRALCDTICVPPTATVVDGGEPPATATEAGFAVTFCHVVQDLDEPAVFCSGSFPDACIGGRRPALLSGRAAREEASPDGAAREEASPDGAAREEASPDGAAFAALCRMESAAVLAFVELAVELAAHGAPDALVRRALAAAIDEVTHAEMASRLSISRGAVPETAVVAVAEIRTLHGILIDNAIEGRAREGWAAIAASVDAREASDVEARRTLGRIAVEEAGHAELSRAIEAWGLSLSSPRERARVRDARVEEIESLVRLVEGGDAVGVGARSSERTVDRVRAFARAEIAA